MGDFYSSGKRKSKQRSASSSSESKSPLDKRSRETQDEQTEVFVEEPRGADEVSVALDMALDVTTKLDEILAKLGKLDAIEATLHELRQKMSSVEREVSKLKGDVSKAKERIDHMDTSLQWFNTEVKGIQDKIKVLNLAKENLYTQQLYAESYSRRENLKFFGIEERETGANSKDSEKVDTRDILIDFLENGLGLDNPAEEIELQRVHRLGKPVAGKIRPIIARFLRYPDRERVLRASFRLSRESEIKVLEDYPKEIIERRRKQMPKLKEAKKSGLRVAFSKLEPDKLYINGKFAPM
mgnify:CR=1 FL=1